MKQIYNLIVWISSIILWGSILLAFISYNLIYSKIASFVVPVIILPAWVTILLIYAHNLDFEESA